MISFFFISSKRLKIQRNDHFQGMFYHYYKLLIALCISLLLFNVFYIEFAFLNDQNTNKNACKSTGILLHFFLLSSFGIMLSMSVLRYLMIYYVFKDIRSFSLISIFGSFGMYKSDKKKENLSFLDQVILII